MKVACVGGGPAGLYLSILLKLRDPSHDVTVHERNPEGTTYGWGVTYWRGLLDRLHAQDPVTARAIEASSVRWNQGVAHVRDLTARQPGDEGHGIGRHRLLEILADRARSLGVHLDFEHEITPDALPDADLVVACDGVRSTLRARYADHFGTQISMGRNRYVWLGTSKVFDAFTFSFVETAHGWIWCYGYGFGPEASTCVVECSPETFTGLGLHRASEADGLALLEKLFADVLDGHPLRGRPSGTTLALEDAMALAAALYEQPTLPRALAHYEDERRRALLPVQSAARYSALWYENLPRYMQLPPQQMFALLGQRHSPLLPHVPPQLYYRIDRAAGQVETLRRLKRWLGPRVARTVQARSARPYSEGSVPRT